MILTDQQIDDGIADLEKRKRKLLKMKKLADEIWVLEAQINGVFPASHEALGCLQEVVATYYGLTVEQLRAKTRREVIARARQVCFYLAKWVFGIGPNELGKFFGCDHSNVVHGIKAIDTQIEMDPRFRKAVSEIVQKIQEKINSTDKS